MGYGSRQHTATGTSGSESSSDENSDSRLVSLSPCASLSHHPREVGLPSDLGTYDVLVRASKHM